jgi:hypothetical protein
MPVDRSDGAGVEGLVVDQEKVIVRVPAVLVAPDELQCDDVSGDAQPMLQALPGGSCRASLPGGTFGVEESG